MDLPTNQTSNPRVPHKLVISEIVKKDKVHEYNRWIYDINQEIQGFRGFLGIDVIRPRKHTNLEFVIIIKFESYQDLKNWLASPIRISWLEKSNSLVEAESHVELPNQNEMYFSFPNYYPEKHNPSYFKLVTLGVLAVYPLILLVSLIMSPFSQELPSYLHLLFSVILVSMLLNNPVMPILTRFFDFWLYPQKAVREFPQIIESSNSDNFLDTDSKRYN